MTETDRYARHNILRAEQMYGRGLQSPGQLAEVDRAAALLDLRSGERVLDVGSGLGGPAMHLARTHGVRVLGLDTAAAMIELSQERLRESDVDGVGFRQADVRDADLPAESFDVAWTRDTILYVDDKPSVWSVLHDLLRPGGRLYVADFCLGPSAPSSAFASYLATAGYHLQSIPDYAATLQECGFADVHPTDETSAFEDSLAAELDRLQSQRDRFLAEFSTEDYRYLVDRWQAKVDFCRDGQLAWGWFLATRPDTLVDYPTPRA